MLDEIIQTIPVDPGTYLLWLYISQSQKLNIGRLGDFTFIAGEYIYLGSARGPGGLRARLGRHLRGDGKIRWHIDYLRAAAQVRGFGYVNHGRGTMERAPTECDWSQKLAAPNGADLPDAHVPIPRFGASDCQSGCTAHLIYFPALNMDQISSLLNCEIQILSGA
jgi:Uri superfamily endonuclease